MINPFVKFYNCPVCHSKKFENFKSGYLNVYSELISKNLKMNELKLNNLLENIKCKNCGLVYKKKWFSKKMLKNIFNKLVPIHPKGWDVISKKFSVKYFLNKINTLEKSLKKNNNILLINKTLRELISIADSLETKTERENFYKKSLILSIKNKDIFATKYYFKKAKNNFKKPEDFKRFQGFNSPKLIDYIKKKIGNIENYSEVGCPLWGSLKNFQKNGTKCSFIRGNKHEFWGYKCFRRGLRCSETLTKNIPCLKNSSKNYNKKKMDYTAVYLYLDHVIKPVNFLKKLFRFSKSIGIIIEKSNQGVPVQHFTGWNKEAIKYLANILNKKIDMTFKAIHKSKKEFYLIY